MISSPEERTPMGPGSVTVILPIRNEERHIAECLLSVRKQDYKDGPMEILVADGRSTDRTREEVTAVAREDPRVRLLDNPGRIVPTGMNAAIRAARGEYVVRVDGHAAIPVDYVRTIIECFRRRPVQCVGGRMIARGEGYWGEVISRVTSHPFGVGGSRFHYSDREGEADTVYLGAYRRATLLDVGLYDDRFVRNQDDELNYRLAGHGGKVWFDPAVRAEYVNRSNLKRLFSQYFQYGFWKVRLYRKHPRLFKPRHAIPAVFILGWAGLAGLAVFHPVLGLCLALGIPALHVTVGILTALLARWPLRFTLAAPLAFLTLHIAYGAGFWLGLADALFRPSAFRP